MTGRQTRIRPGENGRGTLKHTRLSSTVLIVGLLWFFSGQLYAQNSTISTDEGGAPTQETSVPEAPPPLPAEEDLIFAGGDEAAEDPAAAADEVGAFGVWDLVRMILVLLLVVGAVYGLVVILRRRVGNDTNDEDSPIRVLATKNLGGPRDLHAVMVGKRVLLLGGGESGIQLITTIEDQETIDELVLAHSAGIGMERRSFGAVLSQWAGNLTVPGAGKAGQNTVEGDGARGFLRSQQERLRHMR